MINKAIWIYEMLLLHAWYLLRDSVVLTVTGRYRKPYVSRIRRSQRMQRFYTQSVFASVVSNSNTIRYRVSTSRLFTRGLTYGRSEHCCGWASVMMGSRMEPSRNSTESMVNTLCVGSWVYADVHQREWGWVWGSTEIRTNTIQALRITVIMLTRTHEVSGLYAQLVG